MKRFGTLIAALLLTSTLNPVSIAYAQSPVTVVGPAPVPGNCVSWFSTTQIKDPGITCNGGGGGSTPGGSNLQIQYNNGGSFGGLTDVQVTARIQAATSSLSGALPAWPNNTTTFFRGDGTYQSFASPPAIGGTTPAAGTFTTLTTTNVTGSTQCVQANSSGVLSGSGSACAGNGSQTWIGNFGAVCNGTTDDTTAIQNAWNAAAAANSNLKISGVGPSCKISSLTMPAVISRGFQQPPSASLLVGDGPNSVTLISTVTGTTCAISMTVPLSTPQPTGVTGGFTLVQISGGQVGRGICLNSVTKLNIHNVYIGGFGVGLFAIDTINLHVSDSSFFSNMIGIEGQTTGATRPNAWDINDNVIASSAEVGIILSHPDQVNIYSNTFEVNGTNLSSLPATINISGLPLDGTHGVNIQGNYFEDGQSYEIAIAALAGDTALASYTIANNTFIRNSNNELSPIVLQNAASAVNLMAVTITSNSFLDVSPFSSPGGSSYIAVTNPSTASYQVYCTGNTYNTPAQMVNVCKIPPANAIWSMDSTGAFGGPH